MSRVDNGKLLRESQLPIVVDFDQNRQLDSKVSVGKFCTSANLHFSKSALLQICTSANSHSYTSASLL